MAGRQARNPDNSLIRRWPVSVFHLHRGVAELEAFRQMALHRGNGGVRRQAFRDLHVQREVWIVGIDGPGVNMVDIDHFRQGP